MRRRRNQQNPSGGENIGGVVVLGIHFARRLAQRFGFAFEDRFQIEIAVRDVYGEDPIRLEMVKIELHGLAREQVHGNRIAGKSVDGENVEIFGRFAFEREARIAHRDFELAAAIAHEGELRPGDPWHQRVNFVIADVIAPAPVGGYGAGAKPDHADAYRAVLLLFANGDSDASVGTVICRRQIAARRIEKLLAMADGAVGELPA